jgi:hypothetical protein
MTDFKPYPIKEALEIIKNAKSVYVLSQISFKKPSPENKLRQYSYCVALSKKDKAEMIKKFSDWREDLTMDLEIDGEEICIG